MFGAWKKAPSSRKNLKNCLSINCSWCWRVLCYYLFLSQIYLENETPPEKEEFPCWLLSYSSQYSHSVPENVASRYTLSLCAGQLCLFTLDYLIQPHVAFCQKMYMCWPKLGQLTVLVWCSSKARWFNSILFASQLWTTNMEMAMF